MASSAGESAAKERLQGWMFDRDCLKEYFEVRNGMLGADYSTKLAPWLALGCVSARRVAAEVDLPRPAQVAAPAAVRIPILRP